MRGFRFTAKNIGDERYLTYIMGEGCELDEDALDICEDGVSGLVGIIYEEDDDFDYLTYDITGKTALENYTKGTVDKKTVFTLVRNVAKGIIEFKEVGIPLSYILLNRNFMYVNPDTLEIEYICVPVESEGSVAAEFKAFMRQFIANLIYNVNEDLGYVGQLLTYINGESFNLRGLIGLVEALMKDSGMDYEAEGDIATADGDVVVNTEILAGGDQGVSGYMNNLEDADENLPEIGDDDDEDEVELEAVAEEEIEEAEAAEEEVAEEEAAEEEYDDDDDDDGPETVTIADIRAAQKSVKVNRAALIQNNAHGEAEEEKQSPEQNEENTSNKKKDKAKKKDKEKAKEEPKVETPEEAPAATEADAAATQAAAVSESADIKINPYIVRETTNERAMINKPVFKLGKATRGVDYRVDGNNAISRIHAIITLKENNQYYIKDNKSTNHTYVNNVQLEPDQEVLLTNNCTITLGDEDFLFKF